MFGKIHMYVLHLLSQPIIKEYPSLEYFVERLKAVESKKDNKLCNVVNKESSPINKSGVDKKNGVYKENGALY